MVLTAPVNMRDEQLAGKTMHVINAELTQRRSVFSIRIGSIEPAFTPDHPPDATLSIHQSAVCVKRL